jgi:hypothetical protein
MQVIDENGNLVEVSLDDEDENADRKKERQRKKRKQGGKSGNRSGKVRLLFRPILAAALTKPLATELTKPL